MAGQLSIFLSSLLLLATATALPTVEYTVTNQAETTPGGIRFNNEIGAEYTKQTMAKATDFIWRLFQYTTEADRKNLTLVPLYIDNMTGGAAYSYNGDIHFSDDFIEGVQGDVKADFTGVLYHEMGHVWQWEPANAPVGLVEGIADFVSLKANYIYVPTIWVKPGEGSRWDEGYSVTARFLDYCNDLRNGFVAELNKKMRATYSDGFFMELLGKSVDQLWSDYKAKYGKN